MRRPRRPRRRASPKADARAARLAEERARRQAHRELVDRCLAVLALRRVLGGEHGASVAACLDVSRPTLDRLLAHAYRLAGDENVPASIGVREARRLAWPPRIDPIERIAARRQKHVGITGSEYRTPSRRVP